MRILIAEDDSILADGLSRSLRYDGYAVDVVADGSRMHGLGVLRLLRQRNTPLPVLILTAADTIEQRVKGLDLGADDYMAKPFALSELEARVRALTRRSSGSSTTLIRYKRLSFDLNGRIARIDDLPLELSARETSLLEIFLSRCGRMISKNQFVDLLCEWGEEVTPNAIEVYIHRLRKKLEPSGAKIVTVRGLGYCLEAENRNDSIAA